MGGKSLEGARLFSLAPCDRTRGTGRKLKHMKFCLNTRKHFLTVRLVKCWNSLLRESVESASVEIFKTQLPFPGKPELADSA